MSNITKGRIRDSLNIIWTIAAKDILDSLKNRLVISMIFVLSLMLLLPRLLAFIFEQPALNIPVYAAQDSAGLAVLQKAPDLLILRTHSEDEFKQALCSALFPEIGLLLPADFDQRIAAGGPLELKGYMCWGKRRQVGDVQPRLEAQLSQTLDRLVTLNLAGNLVYPPVDNGLFLSMATMNSVLMILMMGIFLVPTLFFEEKQTKTMQALLVSPASIGQVVAGKALAGWFYILVTAGMIFLISWPDVVHWGQAILFVVAGGFFSVAIGLVLGSFFDKQQDMAGWMTLLILVLIGAILIKMLNLELPALLAQLLPWIPGVALAEICHAAFSETFSVSQVLSNLRLILVFSILLYALVVWKVRRFDR
jgi:ABC-2 type transport system permease protein